MYYFEIKYIKALPPIIHPYIIRDSLRRAFLQREIITELKQGRK